MVDATKEEGGQSDRWCDGLAPYIKRLDSTKRSEKQIKNAWMIQTSIRAHEHEYNDGS